MCQVHTGAYVSFFVPGKTDYIYRLPPKKDYHVYIARPPKKDYHVYIARSIYHFAYARQTQVNRRKETKKRKDEENITRLLQSNNWHTILIVF